MQWSAVTLQSAAELAPNWHMIPQSQVDSYSAILNEWTAIHNSFIAYNGLNYRDASIKIITENNNLHFIVYPINDILASL